MLINRVQTNFGVKFDHSIQVVLEMDLIDRSGWFEKQKQQKNLLALRLQPTYPVIFHNNDDEDDHIILFIICTLFWIWLFMVMIMMMM